MVDLVKQPSFCQFYGNEGLWFVSHNSNLLIMYARRGQQVDRDRPVDRRVSVGRSRLILH